MRPRFALAATLAFCLVPEIADACSSCLSGRSEETRVAFIATTGFLTGLPLLLIGSLVWWLRRRALQLQQGESHSRAPKVPDGVRSNASPASRPRAAKPCLAAKRL